MPRDTQLGTRVEKKIKELLDKAAKDERRTTNDLVNIILEDWLIENGYLKQKG